MIPFKKLNWPRIKWHESARNVDTSFEYLLGCTANRICPRDCRWLSCDVIEKFSPHVQCQLETTAIIYSLICINKNRRERKKILLVLFNWLLVWHWGVRLQLILHMWFNGKPYHWLTYFRLLWKTQLRIDVFICTEFESATANREKNNQRTRLHLKFEWNILIA